MSSRRRIAIVGFSRFERESLESYFRLSEPGTSAAWMLVDSIAECDLVVGDAEQPSTLYAVGRAGRVPDAVFIGTGSVPASAGAHLSRPVDVLQVQRALETLYERRLRRHGLAAGDTAASGAAARNPRPVGRVRQQALDKQTVQDFRASDGFSNSVLVDGDARLDEVLVVSASPAERRLWRDLLGRYGYGVSLALDGEEAVRMTDSCAYGFVFLGLGQDGQDGYQACRHIKRRATPTGLAPVIVAIAQRSGAMGRIRATFAGCDAYLTAPLNEDDLLRLLARHDRTFERVFEPTAPLPA